MFPPTNVGQLDASLADELERLGCILWERASQRYGRNMHVKDLTSAFWTRILGLLLYRPRLVSDMISCRVVRTSDTNAQHQHVDLREAVCVSWGSGCT